MLPRLPVAADCFDSPATVTSNTAVTSNDTDKQRRPLWIYLLGGMAILFGGGSLALLGLALLFLSGTDRDLDDFDSQQEARAFVAGHLPLAPPDSTRVLGLTYNKFTDWSLRAELQFSDKATADAFVSELTAARQQDIEYCGAPSNPADTGYFLPQWSACGRVSVRPPGNVLQIECNTR